PSTGYQKRSPATKTFGSWWYTPSSPSLIVTIHLNWSVFSAIGSPSLSGYSIAGLCGVAVVLLMAVRTSRGPYQHHRSILPGRPPNGQLDGGPRPLPRSPTRDAIEDLGSTSEAGPGASPRRQGPGKGKDRSHHGRSQRRRRPVGRADLRDQQLPARDRR